MDTFDKIPREYMGILLTESRVPSGMPCFGGMGLP